MRQKPLSKADRRAHDMRVARPAVTGVAKGRSTTSSCRGADIARAFASNYRSEESLHRDFQAVMTAKHEGKI